GFGPPGAAHRSQGVQRSRFTKTFFQPEIGMGWITHQLARPIAEVGQGMTELVRKLKAVLRPMSVLSGQANRDAAGGRPLEVRLRMIRPMIDVDPAQLSPRAVAPKFKACRLQKGGQIGGTGRSKPVCLDADIQWPRNVGRGQRANRREKNRAANQETNRSAEGYHKRVGRFGLLDSQTTSI